MTIGSATVIGAILLEWFNPLESCQVRLLVFSVEGEKGDLASSIGRLTTHECQEKTLAEAEDLGCCVRICHVGNLELESTLIGQRMVNQGELYPIGNLATQESLQLRLIVGTGPSIPSLIKLNVKPSDRTACLVDKGAIQVLHLVPFNDKRPLKIDHFFGASACWNDNLIDELSSQWVM